VSCLLYVMAAAHSQAKREMASNLPSTFCVHSLFYNYTCRPTFRLLLHFLCAYSLFYTCRPTFQLLLSHVLSTLGLSG